MSNVATGNPWILDTAEVITTNLVMVEKMTWVPNAADNDLQIEDNAGKVVWRTRAIAAASNYESVGQETFEGPMLMNGFEVAVIDAGYLYVYLR